MRSPNRRTGVRRVAAAAAAASLATLIAAQTTPTPQTPPQTLPRSTADQRPISTSENLDAMVKFHGDFRRSVLAELQRVASKEGRQMDLQSLIITSCNERSMLAGVSVSGGSSLPRPGEGVPGDVRRDPADPLDRPGTNPDDFEGPGGVERPVPDRPSTSVEGRTVQPIERETLGLVVVAGTFLRVHSREPNAAPVTPDAREREPGEPRDLSPIGFVTLQPGFYNVRRGPRANTLELVDLDDRVALTIPYRPGDLPGINRPVEAGAPRDFGRDPIQRELPDRGADDRNTPGDPGAGDDDRGDGISGRTRPIERHDGLSRAEQWPEIYMEILHALDLTGQAR